MAETIVLDTSIVAEPTIRAEVTVSGNRSETRTETIGVPTALIPALLTDPDGDEVSDLLFPLTGGSEDTWVRAEITRCADHRIVGLSVEAEG